MQRLYLFSCFFFFLAISLLPAQNTATFTTGSGDQIQLFLDELVFADEGIAHHSRRRHLQRHPDNLVGPPDMKKGVGWPNRKVTSLGCYGSVSAVFTKHGFVDGPGPDLLLFEEGAVMEGTRLSISTNGKHWINLGKIKGGKTAIDIAHPQTEGKVFHYVRLRDLGTRCDAAPNDGADIDAVGAIHYVYVDELLEENAPEEDTPDTELVQNDSEVSKREASPGSTTPDFTVFPNPTNAELNIKFDLEKESTVNLRVFNHAGKVLKTIVANEKRPAGLQVIHYSLGALPAGTYYVQLEVNGESTVKKLIKHNK